MPLYDILLPITHSFHWELKPFFYLFRKFWGDAQVTILSDLDPQIPKTKFAPLHHTIGHDWSGSFSNNLLSYLKYSCRTDFVVIMMGDYWLTDFVNLKKLRTLVNYMSGEPEVIRLQISNGMDSASSEVIQKFKGIEVRNRDSFFRGSLIPGLWSKRLLIEHLKPNLDVWGTEQELSKTIDSNPNLKSYLILPEVMQYEHIAKTSSRRVDFSSFPSNLKEEIIQFVPSRFTILG